jgi:hypothetical protein
MALRRLINLLPFAFVVHNAEETWTIGQMGSIGPFAAMLPQFIIAVGLVTLLGFAIVFLHGWRGWNYAVTAFAGALFLNVFFPHILAAVWYGRYMPGLVSAMVLILPLTAAILWKIRKAGWFPPRRFWLTILSGGVAGVVVVAVSQGIGYLVSGWI